MTLCTWNINSVRLRLPLVAKLAQERGPDVICLQEIKCRDAEFPLAALRELGYPHILFHGQKGYHGVAILSRLPIALVEKRDFCGMGDARHIAARFTDPEQPLHGATLHNFYVPAGGDEPDPAINAKFDHKLRFVAAMGDWFAERPAGPAIVVGDLNIAPLEHDVWSHKALLKVVSHTPVETELFQAVFARGGWADALRHFTPPDRKLYTWWSYRSPDWASADKGRRLDHVWVSPDLRDAIAEVEVMREARGWERPSDHAPVIVRLATPG